MSDDTANRIIERFRIILDTEYGKVLGGQSITVARAVDVLSRALKEEEISMSDDTSQPSNGNEQTIEEILNRAAKYGYNITSVESTKYADVMSVEEAKQAILDLLLGLPELKDEPVKKLTVDNQAWAKYAYVRNGTREDIRQAITQALGGK